MNGIVTHPCYLPPETFSTEMSSPAVLYLPSLKLFLLHEALPEIELFELVDAFRRILAKAPRENFHEVGSENISIADRISDILEFLQGRDLVEFEELFAGSNTREYIVASFLAILELCRLRMIRILQYETYGKLLIRNSVILAVDDSVE